MLKALIFPFACAVGAAGTDMILAQLPIPRGVGPSGPVPVSPIVRWGIPLAVLAGGTMLTKKFSGGLRGVASGVALNGALHTLGNLSAAVDVNYGGNY
jgi:hypothetical protein